MRKDPKRQNHPWSVYIIWLFVLSILLFVLAGVVNHFAFSHHGPGLLLPLVEKFQEKETPAMLQLRQQRYAEQHEHFHHVVEASQIPETLHTTCNICHPTLAHSKTQKTRSILNMHSNYLACEACHLKVKEGRRIVYKWYSPLEANPVGPFFGTAYDPGSGELLFGSDRVSKIVPFYQEGGTMEVALLRGQQEEAEEYMGTMEGLSVDQRKAATEKFHTDIDPKGLECQTCHSTSSILNLKELGFSEKRISDLQTLSIKGIFTKYDEFYLPDIFNQYGVPAASGQDGQ
jgi:ferredoxin-like protein FixX